MNLLQSRRRRGGGRGRALAIAAVATALAAGSAGAAVTIINDGFESSTHPSAFRITGVVAPGAPFYAVKPSGTATIGPDSNFGNGAGNQALAVTSTSGTNNPVLAPFGGISTLTNTGDTITLSFKFRFTNQGTAAANNTNLRFGIESSNGSSVTADNQTSTSDNDLGFYAQIGDVAQATNNLFYQETGTTSTILSGGDRTVITSSAGTAALADNAVHTVSFTLTKNANNIGLSLSIDGGAAITGTSATASPVSFDEIAFSNGFVSPSMSFAIDDVQVTATNFTVPEPAAAGLAVVGALAALGRRRAVKR